MNYSSSSGHRHRRILPPHTTTSTSNDTSSQSSRPHTRVLPPTLRQPAVLTLETLPHSARSTSSQSKGGTIRATPLRPRRAATATSSTGPHHVPIVLVSSSFSRRWRGGGLHSLLPCRYTRQTTTGAIANGMAKALMWGHDRRRCCRLCVLGVVLRGRGRASVCT